MQTVCLPSPDVPEAMGGAKFGAQLFAADFTIKNVFTNAGTNGDYEWAGIFTPYTPGHGERRTRPARSRLARSWACPRR